MKSKLLTQEYILEKDFKEYMALFVEISEAQLDILADWLLKFNLKGNEGLTSIPSVKSLADKTKLPDDTILAAVKVSRFLTFSAADLGENISDIVDDMCELGLVPESKLQKMQRYFKRVEEKGKEFLTESRVSDYEKGGIPILRVLNYYADSRLVLEKDFDVIKDKIEEYVPKGMKLAPVAIIELTIDDGSRQEPVVFQVGSRGLERVIVTLQAAQKELRLMEKIVENIDFTKV